MKCIVAFALIFCINANAEIFKGVNYYSTLGNIRKNLPNATFQKLTPAWLTEKDGFYKISGQGFGGNLYIKFDDARPFLKTLIKGNEADSDYWKKEANASDNDALTVDWVRWVPDSPVPKEKAVSKYGTPKCSVADDFSNICTFDKFSVVASMDDSGKNILGFDTYFTKNERQIGWKLRFPNAEIPEHLK
jgi:hypothetical protein